MLLVGAGLLVRTLYNLSRVDVGFNADNLLVLRINPALQNDSSPRVFDLYDRIMAAIEAVPGVRSCTMSVMPLVARSEWEEPVQPDGAGLPKNAFIQIARWNFLETMGIPWSRGGTCRPPTRKVVLAWPSSTKRWHGRCLVSACLSGAIFSL